MVRPRIGDAPQHYLLATEVLPRGLVVAALRQLARARAPQSARILTVSTLRETKAVQVLGGDLYTAVGNHLSHRDPTGNSWRVYFPRTVEPVNYDRAYERAAWLLQRGVTRQATCLALNISDVSITRNVELPQQRGTLPDTTEADVARGYEHCVKYHADKVASFSPHVLGLVGQALQLMTELP